MKRLSIIGILLLVTVAIGGSITQWFVGESMTPTQMNVNFQHLHNNMVGGHGARLVNSDVHPNAAIKQSKVVSGADNYPINTGYPKAVVVIHEPNAPTSMCTGTCAVTVLAKQPGVTVTAAQDGDNIVVTYVGPGASSVTGMCSAIGPTTTISGTFASCFMVLTTRSAGQAVFTILPVDITQYNLEISTSAVINLVIQ